MQESANSQQVEIKGTPDEIKGWNWGAFAFNVWWGIGNKTYLPLLCLIPLFNIIWAFVCGFKGNEWAWNNSDHNDIEGFKKTQKTWNLAGLVYFLVNVVLSLFVIYWMYSLINGLNSLGEMY